MFFVALINNYVILFNVVIIEVWHEYPGQKIERKRVIETEDR